MIFTEMFTKMNEIIFAVNLFVLESARRMPDKCNESIFPALLFLEFKFFKILTGRKFYFKNNFIHFCKNFCKKSDFEKIRICGDSLSWPLFRFLYRNSIFGEFRIHFLCSNLILASSGYYFVCRN